MAAILRDNLDGAPLRYQPGHLLRTERADYARRDEKRKLWGRTGGREGGKCEGKTN